MSNNTERVKELSSALARAIRILTKGASIVDGKVTSVDTDAYTCDVEVGDSNGAVTIYDVPLRVLIGSRASVVEIPVAGSNCLIGFRDSDLGRPQLVSVHSTDKLLINCGSVVFNDGGNGGLVKVEELRQQSEKDKKIIDVLLNVISGSEITEAGNGAPSSLQSALKAALTGLQSGSWDNLADDKVKH